MPAAPSPQRDPKFTTKAVLWNEHLGRPTWHRFVCVVEAVLPAFADADGRGGGPAWEYIFESVEPHQGDKFAQRVWGNSHRALSSHDEVFTRGAA